MRREENGDVDENRDKKGRGEGRGGEGEGRGRKGDGLSVYCSLPSSLSYNPGIISIQLVRVSNKSRFLRQMPHYHHRVNPRRVKGQSRHLVITGSRQ